MIWMMLITLLGLFLLGMPIIVAIGSVVLFYLYFVSDIPLSVVPQQTIGAIDSFLLLAIPMFLLTGQLMTEADITRRLVRFSQSLVGWIRGGIGHVNVMTNVFMAGISGSGLADAAAIGSAMIPMMKRSGYSAAFSAALTGCAACIGPLIPPSIIMVLIGGLTSVSIARMFLGGVIPGLLLAVFFFAIVYIAARKKDFPAAQKWDSRELGRSFVSVLPCLGLPFIIVGGILTGVFTATESAGVAAAYTICLGLVYRQMTWRSFYRVVIEVGVTTGAIMFVVGVSGILGWILISESVGQMIVEYLTGITQNKSAMLAIITAVLLVFGCFLEVIAVLILVIPVLMPLVILVGIDPVHFGVVATIALTTGLVTPPFGLGMFLMCRVSGARIEQFSKEFIPFFLAILLAIALVIVFPDLVVWLPNAVLD